MTTDTHLAVPTRFVEGNGMTAQTIRKDDVRSLAGSALRFSRRSATPDTFLIR